MKKIDYIKTGITLLGSFLTSIFGALAIPVLLLVASNVIDYITGLIASKYRHEDINSYKSIRGIYKKVCMWLLVVVGAIVDEMIKYGGHAVGIKIPFTFLIACIVALWLICNEIISIVENLKDIGVPIPKFFLPLVKNIRTQVEDKVNINQSEEEE